MVKIKRIYDKPAESDGSRVLVDRLRPTDLNKEDAKIDYWMKGIAPSDNLRKWVAHREEALQGFKKYYFEELNGKRDSLKQYQLNSRSCQ